jgi:hypothetical protein
MCITPDSQEAEIRRITVQSQPGQIICETLFPKNPSQKKAGGVAEATGLKFKPHFTHTQTST